MLKQSQQQKLFQRLSPQQIRIMKLLEITSLNLDQRIKEELEENPALEMGNERGDDDDIYQLDQQDDDLGGMQDEDVDLTEGEGENMHLDDFLKMEDDYDHEYGGKGEENSSSSMLADTSFHEFLMDQLRMLDLDERRNTIATHIIGSIDDDGFLRREVPAIIDDLAFTYNISTTPEEVNELLAKIRDFDPPGVGAWTLEESLLIQLSKVRAPGRTIRIARRIIGHHFNDLINKYYERVQRTVGISESEFKDALTIISRLTPKPGASFGSLNKGETHVTPDFYVYNHNGKMEVSLNALNAPELRISEGYMDMMKAYDRAPKKNKEQREAVHFIKQKLDGARWFIDAIRQRQHTMIQTMQTIVHMQQRFFETGDESTLRPMVLKDVAAETGFDISTISRVTNSKYVQTEYGTFRLKFFFSESMQHESGEEVSSHEVKKVLTDLIQAEDKQNPLGDEVLKDMLAERGYHIARRTIAKYREMLGIPVARLRRVL